MNIALPARSGGMRQLGRRFAMAVVAVLAAWVVVAAAPARAEFGIADFSAAATRSDGTVDFQAGSHPFALTVALAMNTDGSSEPEAELHALRLDLPPGLVGNPLAVPRCSRQDFEGEVPHCPGESQVGVVHATASGIGDVEAPLYNLEPQPGEVAAFGFTVSGIRGLERATLRPDGSGTSISVDPVSNGGIVQLTETIWGTPADAAHDAERVCVGPDRSLVQGCGSNAPPTPFLTLPTPCASPLRYVAVAKTLDGGGATSRREALSLDPAGDPTALIGCGAMHFEPTMSVGFASDAADSPTGAVVGIHLPQPNATLSLAEAHLRQAVVELPEGMVVNPARAAGLAACSPAQIGLESAPGTVPATFSAAPAGCPAAAKIGSVEIETPLADHPLAGDVYLATPDQNPFGSLLALYLVVDDEESGIALKLPAEITADADSGRLTLKLREAPQLPFEDLVLSFPEGPRALLRTPSVCGAGSVVGDFTPWSAPDGPTVRRTVSTRVAVGAGGTGPCPATAADAPNAPSFSAGTLGPAAGKASTFVLRVSRADGTQGLKAIDATLPAGLAAKLAGVPTCAEVAIAALACPAASAVGSVDVAAGAGPLLLHLPGRAYLAGPYEGAPFSFEVLVPAVAGPFDLGTVAVRVALQVDPRTAQIRAVSDPFPTILQGIPLDLRSLTLKLDRPGFVLNPTSCEPQAVTASVISQLGTAAPLSDRFQLGECRALRLRPRLSVRITGPPSRGVHPGLRAVLHASAGDADLRRAEVTLPGTELLDSRHIADVCPVVELQRDRCSPASRIGRIAVSTPLFDTPLQGSAYLLASSGRLPGVGAVLRGGINLEVRGAITSAKGRLRLVLPYLPDLPLGRLELRLAGGRRGLFVNTGRVCASHPRIGAELVAYSGRRAVLSPRLQSDCRK